MRYIKGDLIHSLAASVVNSSNQTNLQFKRLCFGLHTGDKYGKLERQVYSGATAENIFLTANQIVHANNEV